MPDDRPPPPPPPEPPAAPRTDGVLLSLLAAVLLVVAGASWLLDRRIRGLEQRLGGPAAAEAPPAEPGGRSRGGETPEAAARGVTLQSLSADLQKASEDSYQYYVDASQDLQELKRTVRQIQNVLRNFNAGRPGMTRGRWGLPELGRRPAAEVIERSRADAEAFGVKVAEGRVEIPGFLNMSPNRAMPIEHFVTRWPVLGHETLVHVNGNVKLSEMTEDRLRGLPTAVYKAMVAAGFEQGEGSRFEEGEGGARGLWIPPTGDKVYVGVRYVLAGKTHVARATDWVVDPTTSSVLSEEAFRFTGSRRMEDPETGDETLSAEESGYVVSVYFTPSALVEIALPSNVSNTYQYNYARIPRPEGEGPLLLDLILSKTPIAVEGDGAKVVEPIVEPPADVDPGTKPDAPAPPRDPEAPR